MTYCLFSECAHRRQVLMDRVGIGNAVLLMAAPEVLRTGDTYYPYRQHSDFYYLSGFCEPKSLLLLVPGHPKGGYILFNQPRDRKAELWKGARVGQELAVSHYGADQAFPIESLEQLLPLFLGECETLYTLPTYPEIHGASRYVRAVEDVRPMLHEMRLYKRPYEIACLRQAALISVAAHQRMMAHCRPGSYEYQLSAELSYGFHSHNTVPAYPSIVAGGSRGCVLHYTENTERIEKGQLVLVDAGAEYGHYAADITRTFPANGRFTEAQRLVYELVLRTQSAVIAAIQPGVLWSVLEDITQQTLSEGLRDLGFSSRLPLESFYMHRFGHWLGLDVHDVGSYRVKEKSRSLEPGMVFTVEPGLYIAQDCMEVASRWRGIAVRIEDNVLVTERGCEVLTGDLEKTVAALEERIGSAGSC